MTLLFLLSLALLGFVMKLVAMLMPQRRPCPGWRFVTSPLLAPTSLRRHRSATGVRGIVLHWLVFTVLLAVAYAGHREVVQRFDLRGPVLSYLALPMPLLFGEVLAPLMVFLWLPAGSVLPRLFHNPAAAGSLADFWGRRWNLWFSDWFRHVIFDPLRHRPVLALWLVFAVSGLMHELVINVPLLLVTGTNLLGGMMIYFLLQGAGVLAEHRLLRRRPVAKRMFAWLMVAGPAPLMINEGLLRVFHLWPQ